MEHKLIVIDDFLPDPIAFRERVLKVPFKDVPAPDGQIYKRVSVQRDAEFEQLLVDSQESERIQIVASALRLNFDGELPNQSIHSDLGYGDFATVFYLTDDDNSMGGTAFWRHKESGLDALPDVNLSKANTLEALAKVEKDWEDQSKWDLAGFVGMKFNRLIVYPTRVFHSRYPFKAFGNDEKNGRLIFVVFFNKIV